MRNYVERGSTLTVSAPYQLQPGQGCEVGHFFGVAKGAAAQGLPIVLEIDGVYDLAKHAGDVFAQGDLAYWDNVNLVVTSVAAGNKAIGGAWLPAAAGDATVRIYLNGIAA